MRKPLPSANSTTVPTVAAALWKLDRLGRSLRHLVLMLDQWQALGVALVSLNEGIDLTTPAGRLQDRAVRRERGGVKARRRP